MTAKVVALWRHPIKSHGRETLDRVHLSKGQTMPWDRTWAVAHEASKADNSAWSPCVNFSIGAKVPALMGIDAVLNEAAGTVTLSHPDLPTVTLNPDTHPERLISWVRKVMPEDRAASTRVVRVPGRGMTDSDFPSVSIGNMATHRAIEQKIGRPLSERRWRLNIWLDGLAPWEEFDWVGKTLRIGDVRLDVQDRIQRCKSTMANPDTGRRDADTLGVLNSWGHQDMGVYAQVSASGDIAVGDTLHVD